MKVTRFPSNPGPAGWNALLPPPAKAQVLSDNIATDFLVIGGGFAGLAATRRLAQLHPGAKIVLLEARRIGEGPAGRNTGFMIDLPHDLTSEDYGGALDVDKAQTAANRAAIGFAAQATAEYGLSYEAFNQPGKINAAATDKGHRHNQEYAQHLAAMDETHELLDAAQMRDLTGTSYYQSGLYTPGAALIQPALFVRGVAKGLSSNNVRLFEESPVTDLSRKDAWRAKTPRGTVVAPKVILCVNGHISSFGQFRGQLLHVFTYASMTRALNADELSILGGQNRWALTPADPLGTTVRRISGTGGDRIVVRNRFTCEPSMTAGASQMAKVARAHDKAFTARFPVLAGIEMQYRWGGLLCLSRNSVPALGQVEEGLFVACCQNGLGVAKGTLHGMLMAELASGHTSDLLEVVMAQPGPQKLPPPPLTAIGANALIRWGEFRAGREL